VASDKFKNQQLSGIPWLTLEPTVLSLPDVLEYIHLSDQASRPVSLRSAHHQLTNQPPKAAFIKDVVVGRPRLTCKRFSGRKTDEILCWRSSRGRQFARAQKRTSPGEAPRMVGWMQQYVHSVDVNDFVLQCITMPDCQRVGDPTTLWMEMFLPSLARPIDAQPVSRLQNKTKRVLPPLSRSLLTSSRVIVTYYDRVLSST